MDITGLSEYTKYLSDTNDVQAQQIKSKITNIADSKDKKDEELLEACKEFESYLLEQVFKAMDKTVLRDKSKSTNYTNQMSDYFKDMTIKEVASQSTKTQGLGLAQMLYEQMKRNYNPDTIIDTLPEDDGVI